MTSLAGNYKHSAPRESPPSPNQPRGQGGSPETSPHPRHVRFATALSSNDLLKIEENEISGKVGNEPRKSFPNVHSGSTLGPPRVVAHHGGRRQSMFARHYNPSLLENKPVVTCIPPIIRFRRAGRIIKMLCMVCIACRKSMSYSVSQNSWVALKEALLRESDVSKDQDKEKSKGLNTDDPELSFDLSKFRIASKDHDVMPVKIKELLRKSPGKRTPEENANIMRSMQKLELFARYPLNVQRRLSAKAWLEEYDANRVILRTGHFPQSFYFVICGRLVANEEEDAGHTVTTLLKRGDKFGEDELATGSKRSATVMSQDNVELFVVHADEYKDICLAKGDTDIRNLDICKKNPVFNHWPIQKLIDNPGSWTMQNYKSGTLIVEDSSRCEWVYVIRSGQCKVVKCLRPNEPEDDPLKIKRILAKHARDKLIKEIETNNVQSAAKLNGIDDDADRAGLAPSSTFFTTPLSRPQTFDNPDPVVQAAIREAAKRQMIPTSGNIPFLSSLYGNNLDKIAYVALEVLSEGDSFGFLAVLPKEQRGSSVSLVSCGAEVIQINKKFFQKFADETVYSLINMKFPPFPKRHDILHNLKQSFKWEDYKKKTIDDALHHLYRPLVKP